METPFKHINTCTALIPNTETTDYPLDLPFTYTLLARDWNLLTAARPGKLAMLK
jgi:hypothetical protein